MLWFKKKPKNSLSEAFLRGEDVNLDFNSYISQDEALKYSVYFACLRILAETFTSVPINEYKKLKNGDKEKTDDTGLLDILKNVTNSEMSSRSAFEMAVNQINLGGNIVFERQYNMLGELVGLYPYPWQHVKIERDKHTDKLIYEIQKPDGYKYRYERKDVFHVAGLSLDGVIGLSPLDYGAKTIQMGRQYDKFTSDFFKNGATFSGTFEVPGHLTDESFKRLYESLKKYKNSAEKSREILILEDGAKYNAMALKFTDAEILSSKKYQAEDLSRFFRVPLHLINMLDKATFNNIEQLSLEFVMYTMLPWFKRFESAINTQLLTAKQRQMGYYFEYNVEGLLRGDIKSRYEAYAMAVDRGIYSINEIRQKENMNAIPDGDMHLMPLNMTELKRETKSEVDNGNEIQKLAWNRKPS